MILQRGRLLSRSHHHNVMSCHIKILQLVNLERHQYCTAARLIAAITITLKVRGDKCQREHWLEDWARLWASELVPPGWCQAELPDAKIWSQPLASYGLPSGSVCCLIELFPSLKEVGRNCEVHLWLFLGELLQNEDLNKPTADVQGQSLNMELK